MKIFFSPASPFVRKVMVVANELGLADTIEKLPSAAGPVARDATIREKNPLGQVPTFITEEGEAIYDSRVICEYLDAKAGGSFFGQGATRWRNLTDAALADGMMNASLLARYETFLRPESFRWTEWVEGQMGKVKDGLARFEGLGDGLGSRLDIGIVSLACSLGYLDFRFPDFDWRSGHPKLAAWYAKFSERPSMQATRP